jgi:hypothetical protein
MKYMVYHPLEPGMTREDFERIAATVLKDTDIKGIRSFFNLSECKGVCILEAPSKDRLIDWLKTNNLPYDTVLEVELEAEGGRVVEYHEPATANTR